MVPPPTFSEKLVEEYPQRGELSDDVDVNYQSSPFIADHKNRILLIVFC